MTFRLIKGLFRVCIEKKKSFCEFFRKNFRIFSFIFWNFRFYREISLQSVFLKNAEFSRSKKCEKSTFLRKFIKKGKNTAWIYMVFMEFFSKFCFAFIFFASFIFEKKCEISRKSHDDLPYTAYWVFYLLTFSLWRHGHTKWILICHKLKIYKYYISHIGKKRTNGCSVKSMGFRWFFGPTGTLKEKN